MTIPPLLLAVLLSFGGLGVLICIIVVCVKCCARARVREQERLLNASYAQNQTQYQTPLETEPAPHQSSQANPDIPATAYNPDARNTRIRHIRSQGRQEREQPSTNQFSSEDIISFDVTSGDKDFPCPICLESLEEEPISTGQCLHLIHSSCLKRWLETDAETACPVCRVPYTDADQAQSASNLSSMAAPS